MGKGKRHLINLNDVLPHKVPLSRIKRVIIRGFEKRFNVKLKKATLTSRERKIAKKLYEIKYSKRHWNEDAHSIKRSFNLTACAHQSKWN